MATTFIINLCHEASAFSPASEKRINILKALKIALKGINANDLRFLKVGLKSSVVTTMISYAEALS
jgi:hypothetical protein